LVFSSFSQEGLKKALKRSKTQAVALIDGCGDGGIYQVNEYKGLNARCFMGFIDFGDHLQCLFLRIYIGMVDLSREYLQIGWSGCSPKASAEFQYRLNHGIRVVS